MLFICNSSLIAVMIMPRPKIRRLVQSRHQSRKDQHIIRLLNNFDSVGQGVGKLVIFGLVHGTGGGSWGYLFHFAPTLMPLDYIVLNASAVVTGRYTDCGSWELFTIK